MSSVIRYFMWGYQPNFRINQEFAAKKIFSLLDKGFDAKVFLVGVLAEDRTDRYPACVEPENDFWVNSTEFDRTRELAEAIRATYKETRSFHSNALAQQWHDDMLTRRAIRDAIQQIVDGNAEKPNDLSWFVSYPSKVEGFFVSVVLGLQTDILEAHPSLKGNKVPIHEDRDMPVATSLIGAAITTYLEKASGELRLPDPGIGSSSLNAEETIRESANKFMMEIAFRTDQDRIEGWHGLLSACNNIARAYYEKSAGVGTIVLAHRDHPAIQRIIDFPRPTNLHVTRGSRKLLQLAAKDLSLHTDSEKIFGLIKVKSYDENREDLFGINFLGHQHWEVTHGDQILMKVRYDQPYLPMPPFDEDKLRIDIKRIFPKSKNKHAELIVALVREAEKESHGTMLLITEAARRESERFRMQGTPIRPKRLNPEILRNLTPIDGAVILNPKGTCYAIGAILDGMATPAGDPGRGSRYNSAIRYIETSTHPCMAIVISEDGGIDFIPNLRPPLKRSQIDNAISTLRQVFSQELIDLRRYNQTMDWLVKHNFYLLPNDCTELNDLSASIENRVRSENPNAIRIVFGEFSPHPEMRPDLYYEEELQCHAG
jgi:hypothetical protein